jgi:MFS family permease
VEPWTTVLLACYAGASLIICPIAGYLTSYFNSRRIPFVIALLALVASTLLLCMASSIAILVLGRLLQGAASAVTWTAGLTLVVDTVGTGNVGSAMGFCSLGMNLALLSSPLVGGLLMEQSGYYAVFTPAFGLLCLDLIWRLAIIERDVAAQWTNSRSENYRVLTYGNAQWTNSRSEDYWVLTYGNDGTPRISPALARIEIPDLECQFLGEDTDVRVLMHGARPSTNQDFNGLLRNLYPWTSILRDHRFQVAFGANIVQITLLSSLDPVLPIFVHRVFSWGPRGAGLIFIPVVIPSLLGVYAGRLTDKYGPKWLVTAGFTAASPLFFLLRLITRDEIGQIILLCTLLTLLSVALAFVGAPLMAEITLALEAQERSCPGLFGPKGAMAQAYALYSVSLFGGILIGTLWGGLLEKAAGWKMMTFSFGILGGLMAIPTSVFTGGVLTLKIFS